MRGNERGWLVAVAVVAVLACGRDEKAAAPPGAAAMTPMRLALNWKPEPEFGGIYEAKRRGLFAEHGIALELTGGPGAPVVQMVEAGKVELGIAAADEVVLARDRGGDVVAVFATYQTNPQGIMVHASRGAASLSDVFLGSGTLAVEPGLAYVKWFEKHYDLSKWKVVPYSYSVGPFLTDPNMAQQVFVTAEPIAAERQGADPKVFLIAESGFDPYAAVVITTGAYWKAHPDRVGAAVAALRAGWRAYLDDPSAANVAMGALNQEMDAETFRLAAEAQKPLVEDDFAKQHGVGAMSLDRWAALAKQLRELGLVDHDVDPAACFVTVP
jgi:NitT/TauT family transport system substrate-binding protein